jgi:hypothetical protein
VYIPRKDFDKMKDNLQAVKEWLDNATDPQYRDFDWTYACSTGNLRKRKGTANLEVNPRTEKRRERQIRQVRKDAAQEQKKTELRRGIFSSASLVMVVMAAVGSGSAVMSAYHTSTFLYEGGKPAWASAMTGIMLILFSGTAFTAARYFFREGKMLNLFGGLFVAAGLVVIAYSMFSTLTVNYNQFRWRDDAQAVVTVEQSEALAAHRERMRLLEEEIDDVIDEIAVLRGDADYWRDRSWARYDNVQEHLTGRSAYLISLRESYGSLVDDTPRLVEVEAVSQETVYAFLGRLFGVEEDAMRFFVYVVPACLYDILAPFALSVVLLLVDERRKQNGQAIRDPAC